jgi:hypothetical protein
MFMRIVPKEPTYLRVERPAERRALLCAIIQSRGSMLRAPRELPNEAIRLERPVQGSEFNVRSCANFQTNPFRSSLPSPFRGKPVRFRLDPTFEMFCAKRSQALGARVQGSRLSEFAKRTHLAEIADFRISDLRLPGNPRSQTAATASFTKRTHFPIRVLGVHSWFNQRICETKPFSGRLNE